MVEYYLSEQVGARIIYWILILIALSIVGILFYIFYRQIKKYIIIYFYEFKKWGRCFYQKLCLLFEIYKLIKKQNNTHTAELVFASFLHFYNKHINELDDLAYPEDMFVLGKTDLMNMYKWITRVRKENYKDKNNLDFRNATNKLLYESILWDGFNYKIKDGLLKIIPYVSNKKILHKENKFQHKLLRLENDLYNLDNVKAQWILERRKYLGI